MKTKAATNSERKLEMKPILKDESDSKVESVPGNSSQETIRFRAYEIYLERGSLSGSELDDWIQAEREMCGA